MQAEEYYCSMMSGEPTQTSVILQARLHKTDTLINNDIEGIEGFIKFFITRDTDSKFIMESDFFHAADSNDFIAKHEFTGLRPRQKYFYRISYGKDTSNLTSSPWNSFKTLNLPASEQNINFIVVSGIINRTFQNVNSPSTVAKNQYGSEKPEYHDFQAISLFQPDFIISSGNKISKDLLKSIPLQTKDDFKKQWHRAFSTPGFSQLLTRFPVYWMNNDFDYYDSNAENRKDQNNVIIPSDDLNKMVYYEQVPLFSGPAIKPAHRTYRLNKDVQIWLLEACVAQSLDVLPTDSERIIWGKSQFKWLKATLRESDAPFKILINPFSITGIYEFDSTETDFKSEVIRAGRDSLFNWLISNGYKKNGLFLISGDSKDQYHSIDPSGFEEFGCGNQVVNNTTTSIFPSDSISGLKGKTIVQPYPPKIVAGGFLVVESGRDEYNSPVLLFRFYDDQKHLQYAVKKY